MKLLKPNMEHKELTFRFKTHSEFYNEFGADWRRTIKLHWIEDMDNMLGMILHKSYNSEIVKTICGLQDSFTMEVIPRWRISSDMIKQIT